MTVFVAGASGATGRLLVSQLLERGLSVKILVRDARAVRGRFPVTDALSILQGSILDIDDATLAGHVRGCDAVASCLGHNLTLKGIFGKPRFLVTDATIEWAAVRPDSLIDEPHGSGYEIHASPTRSPVFNPGKTSRINTAHFTAALIADSDTWKQWKGAMPVIYDRRSMRGA